MMGTEDTVLVGCEVICIGEQDTDLIACPLSKEEQNNCKMRRQYQAGQLDGYETGFNDGQNYSFTANCTIQSIKDEAGQAGIRKVAGWIKANLGGLVSKDSEVFTKAWENYDAKLKEWRIKSN